jgi:hypothetical protein
VLLAGPVVGTARASEPIESLEVSATTAQAGAHPDVSVSVELGAEPAEAVKSMLIDWPAGLTLLPRSAAGCTDADFSEDECGPATQVGVVTIHGDDGEGDPGHLLGTAAVYSLVPDTSALGRLGFVVPEAGDHVEGAIGLRTAGDHGARMSLDGFPEAAALQAAALTIWGVPAAVSHEPERLPKGTTGCPGLADASCGGTSSNLFPTAYTVNPTFCPALPTGSPALELSLSTYEDPAHFTAEDRYPATTGCNLLSFDPLVSWAVGSTSALTPTTVAVAIQSPQFHSATPWGTQLKVAALYFGEGLDAAGDSIAARTVCESPGSELVPASTPPCPESSSLGTATLASPLFSEPAAGEIYYGGFDPGGGYRIWVAATDQGVRVVLRMVLGYEEIEVEDEGGAVETFEALVVEFPELPQVPLEEIDLEFAGGGSAPLVTAGRCGEYPVFLFAEAWSAAHSPWQGEGTQVLDSGPGGGPCPEPGAGGGDGGGGGGGSTLLPGGRPPSTVPAVRIFKHPPRRSRARKVKFAFRAGAGGVSFRCRLDSGRFRRCASPVSYGGLRPAHHRFQVYAVDRSGTHGKTATFRFTTARLHR